MRRYRLTRQARADLHGIFRQGYEWFGETQAEAYAAGLDETFRLLADTPRMGRLAETVAPDVRRHEYRSHVVLYEESADGVLILAVIHARSLRHLEF